MRPAPGVVADVHFESISLETSARGAAACSRVVSPRRGPKDNLGALDRFVGVDAGRARIVDEPPLIVPLRELVGEGMDPEEVERQLRGVLDSYRATLEPERRVLLDRYRLADFARKVVGVGSVGTRSHMALLLGDDERDPLFVQARRQARRCWKGSPDAASTTTRASGSSSGSGSCRP